MSQVNRGDFGLGASVWSTDVDRAARVAEHLAVGMAWVDEHALLGPDVPLAGSRSSGIGAEHGIAGLLANTVLKVLSIRR